MIDSPVLALIIVAVLIIATILFLAYQGVRCWLIPDVKRRHASGEHLTPFGDDRCVSVCKSGDCNGFMGDLPYALCKQGRCAEACKAPFD